MKILMLNYEFPPLGGGAGNANYYLLKEYAKNSSLKIDLITSSIDKYQEKDFSTNIKIYYLDIGKRGNLQYQKNKDLIIYAIKSYYLAQNLKKKNHYNLIHAFFGIPCGFIALLLKIPYIVSLRGSDVPLYNPRYKMLDKLFFKNLSKMIWRKSTKVIANSNGLKELAQKTYLKKNIEVIPNGVDIDNFRPREKSDKNFIVLSTSRLIERKGIEYLIYGFYKFQKKCPNSKLILAGSGNKEDEYKKIVQKLGINEKIDFRGIVSHQDIVKLYQEADVFVLPSLNEGMSNSLLEAMASGLAIISTDTGGANSLINKENGIIVSQKNSKEISDALDQLFRNRSQLESMKISSNIKARKMGWGDISSQYYRIYQGVCAE